MSNTDPTPEQPQRQSEEEILDSILAKNMAKLVRNRELVEKAELKIDERAPGVMDKHAGIDGIIQVSQNEYGRRKDDGSWETGSDIQLGFSYPTEVSNRGRTMFARVGKRINSEEGVLQVPDGNFTQAELAEVVEMVEELEMAKASGQIPNLSHDLLNIYIPSQPDYRGENF